MKIKISVLLLSVFFGATGFAKKSQTSSALPLKKMSAQTQPVRQLTTKELLNIQLPVEKFVLDNGLTVLLLPDHRIPMVAYHTWYKVGSSYEKPGVTGAAHMLEHMMFKGAKKYTGKDFDRILHENGIINNAFTSYDYTGFHETLPSDRLDLIMDLEIDRMKDLEINQEALLSERQVVGEERRWRIDNNPMSQLREVMMEEFFPGSQYRWPVIGWMEDIQAYTSDKLRFFYQQYYVPNNAILVVVGDFDLEKTKKKVTQVYGILKRKPVEDPVIRKDTTKKPTQFTRKEGPVKTPAWMMALPGISGTHPDAYVLDIITSVLTS